MVEARRWSRRVAMLIAWYGCFVAAPVQARFTTVLNIPPDPNIGDNQSIDSDTQLNLFDGGSIGRFFEAGASDGSSTNVEVNVAGGMVGSRSNAYSGSVVNISGGYLGGGFSAYSGSVVNISGGFVVGGSNPHSGSVVNISGGGIGVRFDVFDGSEVNVFGTQFILDDSDLTATLTPNVPLTIGARDFTLNGLLADGSPFSFDLARGVSPFRLGSFDPGATLTITLVPGPCSATLLALAGLALVPGRLRGAREKGTSLILAARARFANLLPCRERPERRKREWSTTFSTGGTDGCGCFTRGPTTRRSSASCRRG